MGSDIGEERAVVTLPSPNDIKVHRLMLIELLRLVGKIITLFPRIEASRPGCSSGREALCSLRTAIDNARSLLQYCAESSKLYLALTSDAILQRCKKSRNALEQFLFQIQNLVPVILADEISGIISDLRRITFSFDSSEEAAGKIIRAFLQQSASNGDSNEIEKSAIETIQFVSMSLRIASQKDLATERKSIKKFLDKASDREPGKKQILVHLLNLLKNYGQLIITEQGNVSFGSEEQFPTTEVDSLEECPMSLRMMYGPVVTSSGMTFERMWIQRWLEEGNGTCPKTKRKLDHFTLIPNVEMEDLISSWCIENGVTVSDPSVQSGATNFSDSSSSTSITSLAISLNDLYNPVDESSNIKSQRTQSCASNHEMDEELLLSANLDELPWDFQCQVVGDLTSHLKRDFRSSENHVHQLLVFMKRANDLSDWVALRNGAQLFLSFLRTCRSSSLNFHEDAYDLLASLLSSDVIGEGLSITEVLSRHECHISKIVSSGTVTSIVDLILKILGTETSQSQDQAIRILYNMSMNRDVCSRIIPSEVVPKLVPFLEDATLVRYCMGILKNMSTREDSLVSIAETNGCIGFIVEALQCRNLEVQENASSILLTLCCHRFEYRHLVMDEGVIPGLVSISNNGNEKGMAMATELLRLLREAESSAYSVNETKVEAKSCNPLKDSVNNYKIKEKKPSGSTIFGIRISGFSKPRRNRP